MIHDTAHIERARMLQELGRHQDALDVLASAAQNDPRDSTLHSLRALSLAGLHRFEEAIAAAHVALQQGPADSFAHFALGKALMLKGEAAAARESFEAALKLQPDNADYYLGLALTFQIEHQLGRAHEALDRVLELDPENRGGLWTKAAIYQMQGQHQPALATVERLLRIEPHFAPALALYESLQRDAGIPVVQPLALRTDPRQRYVKSAALTEILLRSAAFRWVVVVDRFMMRRAPDLGPLTMAVGLLLWSATAMSSALNDTLRSGLGIALWIYSGFVLACIFGWCIGDVYLRFHPQGRSLLSGIRRSGADVVTACTVIGGSLLVIAAMTRSRELAWIAAGFFGGGLCVSRSLATFLRLASPSEFLRLVALSVGFMMMVGAGWGVWNRWFAVSLGACAVAAYVARLAGWPRLVSR